MKLPSHQVISGRLMLLYSVTHYLDKSSEMLIVDAPNGLMEQVLGWQGCTYRRLSSRALLERYGLWVEPESLSTAKLLAAESGVMEYSGPIQAGLATAPPIRERLKCVSVDRAFGHLRNLGLLYLNEMGISDILSGATETIAKQRPVLIIPQNRVSEDFPADWCRSHGYHLFDPELSSCDYVLVPSELSWLEQACVMAMTGGKLDPLGLPPEPEVQARRSAAEEYDALLSHAYPGISSVLENQLLRLRLRVPWAQCGWYDGEGSDDDAWRWSGPEPDSVVLVPVPAPGKYTLLMQCLYFVDDRLKGKGQLFVNGRHIRQLPEDVTNDTLRVPVDVPKEFFDGYVEIQLSFPETIQPSEYDLRRLGLALGDIAISWEGES